MSTKLKNYRTDMMKKYAKMSKASLARKIMKALKKLPKSKLVQLCYELEKRKLPSIERGFQSQVARIPKAPRRTPIPRPIRYAKRKKLKRLVKGSPEAKRYMAKIRKMRMSGSPKSKRRLR